jgi:hypothetical protein
MNAVEPKLVTTADARGPWGPLAEPLHPDREVKPGDPPYRENAFLGFFDRERGFYATAHLQGGKTGTGMWARCSVSVDGRTAEIFEPLSPMSFSSDRISFDLSGHLQASSGDLELDVTMTPGPQVVDYSAGGLPSAKAGEPLQHFQRSGQFEGTVSLGAEALPVDGNVIRDRTWGPREEGTSWSEWMAMFFTFEDFDLAMMKFHAHDAENPPHGSAVGGRTGTVESGAVRRRDPWGNITELEIGLDDGSTIELSLGRPEARIYVPLGDPEGPAAFTAYDDFVEVRTGDGAVGFGISEQGILRRQA